MGLGCTIATVNHFLSDLTIVQGKGVRNIYQPAFQTAFTVGGIESFLESAVRNRQTPRTKVLQFAELEAGEKNKNLFLTKGDGRFIIRP